ncbi:hypothetical protein BH23CHL2_BH23CHL2_08360 [soil metagenome]
MNTIGRAALSTTKNDPVVLTRALSIGPARVRRELARSEAHALPERQCYRSHDRDTGRPSKRQPLHLSLHQNP